MCINIYMSNEFFEDDEINAAAGRFFRIGYVYPYQRLVIHNVLCGCGHFGEEAQQDVVRRQIVILPTGSGKSLCFMLPGALIERPVLMIFPLLSLMSDQERRIREAGQSCAVLRGGQSKSEREEIYAALKDGRLRFLIANPETLLVPSVANAVAEIDFAHVVIDEAHTVSEWGDTFRGAYLELRTILKGVRFDMLTAFTATASSDILNRMKPLIFADEDVNLIYGDPDRVNIHYSVIKTDSKHAALADLIKRAQKPLLVFARSRKRTRDLAVFLREELGSDEIYFYHAGLTKEEKKEREQWFFASDDGILTATCAYGLGVDKQNIRTVIHFDVPPTIEAYLQESGRGGRDRQQAFAYLLFSREDSQFAKTISDPLLRRRYEAVLKYAESQSCRRAFLIDKLDKKSENCSGCDVCDGTVVDRFYLKNFFSPYRFLSRVLTPTAFARVLRGEEFLPDFGISFGKLTCDEKNSEVAADFIDKLYKRKNKIDAKKNFYSAAVFLRAAVKRRRVRSRGSLSK